MTERLYDDGPGTESVTMAFDELLAVRTRNALSRKRGVIEKKMFGGIGFLLNGNLLVGVRKDSILCRVGPEVSEKALTDSSVCEFVIKGRGSMKGWIVVGLESVETDDQLRKWIQRAINFVKKLPAK